MQNVVTTESYLGGGGGIITFCSCLLIKPTLNVGIIVALTISGGLITWAFLKLLFAFIRVNNKTYEITFISNEPEFFDGWGRHKRIKVELKNSATNKTKIVCFLPELVSSFKVGDKVSFLKRQQRHNYETDRYFLIYKDEFDLKRERINYIFDKEIKNYPETGWLFQVIKSSDHNSSKG